MKCNRRCHLTPNQTELKKKVRRAAGGKDRRKRGKKEKKEREGEEGRESWKTKGDRKLRD